MSACDLCGNTRGAMIPWIVNNETRTVCMLCRAKHPKGNETVDEYDGVAAERERIAKMIDEHADGIGAGRGELTDCEQAAASALYDIAARLRAAKGTP